MQTPHRPSKDEYFMHLAIYAAVRSKDTRTHIGAVLVSPSDNLISSGYNGFPRGVNDDVPGRHLKPEKDYWVEHAERNAIYQAAREGIKTLGCRLYTPAIPCSSCARALIQAGIVEVITHAAWPMNKQDPKWQAEEERSIVLLNEAGVTLREIATTLNMEAYCSTKTIVI